MESIVEVESVEAGGPERNMDGFSIKTTRQTVSFLLERFAGCCEVYGTYAVHSDRIAGDFEEPLAHNHHIRLTEERISVHELSTSLVGKTVTSVRIGNAPVSDFGRQLERLSIATLFVDVVLADDDVLQLIAFNDHNGYYPHKVVVEWEGFKDEQEL